MGQLSEEVSQSANIKSPQTRKNVQGALRKIIQFLKRIDFKIPVRGLTIFCGNVSEVEGRADIRIFTVRPLKDLKTKLYWCDSEFHLAPLLDMVQPTDIYGLATLDKREATLAMLKGKRYEILGKFTSGVAGKTRAGGQSAQRFARLREEAEHDFFKRIAEKMNGIFLPYGDKLKGLIVGGPGATKNHFLNTELLDHRLKKVILTTVDISYTDESGIRELVQKSGDILRDTDLMKERAVIDQFMAEVAKDGLAAYGQKEVEEAIGFGQVKTVLVSEDVEWMVYRFKCNSCNKDEEIVVKEPGQFNSTTYKCSQCKGSAELLEEIDYIDFLLEKCQNIGADVKIISTETSEGEQFFKGFGGVGAVLRYK
jgi:peptide chain release factor subunit 1